MSSIAVYHYMLMSAPKRTLAEIKKYTNQTTKFALGRKDGQLVLVFDPSNRKHFSTLTNLLIKHEHELIGFGRISVQEENGELAYNLSWATDEIDTSAGLPRPVSDTEASLLLAQIRVELQAS